ncbi:phosphohydrolase [Clostridium polyendosporum]|uniref:Phosphohydrolase n=1 Tax=Clostridium polyendosporum TaxID=69208 RepID=A0A919VMN1_9CLOT|nr:HD domain-containing protein [Clostridium polyendosporum]GIM29748.1 phosphohydrolase [Clostridium polyendosporum]
MDKKKLLVSDIKSGETIKTSLMIFKKLFIEDNKLFAIVGDKSGSVKAVIPLQRDDINVGDVISIRGKKAHLLEIAQYNKEKDFKEEDYIATVKTPIDEIMNEIESISKEEFKSKEIIELNNYFFKNEEFINLFKKGIAGVSQHHNYRGGLAEHTLNVMYLSKTLAYRYDCRRKEIAILSAKLHDIGKIYEFNTNGPFSYSLRGEMEGHIVIGIQMIEEAFNANPWLYSEDFRERIKGCIVQHHGKLEFGSPRSMNMEESYIVHFADYIDATMNKINQIKEKTELNNWSEYDRRLESKLYL